MDHLNEKAIEYLKLSDRERIAKIKAGRWIGYPRAKQIHTKLDDLFWYPKVARMPSLLLCGDSNAGKSMLVERYVKSQNQHETDEPNLPIFMVQVPPTPSEREFYAECLDKLFTPHRFTDRPDRMRAQVGVILRNLRTRMLVIDEVNNLLSGTYSKQRAFLNTLKFMSNDLRIPIVAVGTRDALHAFQIDAQIANRFEPVALPRWQDGDEFRGLLASFEVSMPLRQPSYLAEDRLARKLLTMSEGLIGELARILGDAGSAAVRTGRERIDADLLDGLGWVLPSERREGATKLLGTP